MRLYFAYHRDEYLFSGPDFFEDVLDFVLGVHRPDPTGRRRHLAGRETSWSPSSSATAALHPVRTLPRCSEPNAVRPGPPR